MRDTRCPLPAVLLPAIVAAILAFAGSALAAEKLNFLLITVGIVAVAIGATLTTRAVALRSARAKCLHLGLCPSCGYTLAGLPTEADGCTKCPECGAGWRLPRSPVNGKHQPPTTSQ